MSGKCVGCRHERAEHHNKPFGVEVGYACSGGFKACNCSGFLDKLARIAHWPLSRDAARAGLCCIRCQDPIDDDWTTHDLKEWELSLLCGQCFDIVTEPGSDDISASRDTSPALGEPR